MLLIIMHNSLARLPNLQKKKLAYIQRQKLFLHTKLYVAGKLLVPRQYVASTGLQFRISILMKTELKLKYSLSNLSVIKCVMNWVNYSRCDSISMKQKYFCSNIMLRLHTLFEFGAKQITMADSASELESDTSSIDGGPTLKPPSPAAVEQLQKRIESLQQENRVLKMELETYKLKCKTLQEEKKELQKASVNIVSIFILFYVFYHIIIYLW